MLSHSSLEMASPILTLNVLPSPGLSVRRVSSIACMDKMEGKKGVKVLPVKKGATKAKVRFSDAKKVIPRKVAVLEPEEEKATWYQPRDYAVIKYEILKSIHAINKVFKQESAAPLDLEKHCLRGIETAISSDLDKRRKHRIANRLHWVLEQQEFQRSIGVSDPLAISAISMQCSQESQESAVSVGKLDSQL